MYFPGYAKFGPGFHYNQGMQSENQLPYYQTHTFQVELGGQVFPAVSKPGIPHWDEITPTIQLLAEAVHLRQDERTLLLGCGQGALAVVLARQQTGAELQLVDPNQVALRVAKETLAVNDFQNIPVEPLRYPLPETAYASILIDLPKGRKFARRWLCEAWGALGPQGALYLAGANAAGIQSVVKDGQALFGNATVLAYRKGCRVVRMVKTSEPTEIPGSPKPAGTGPRPTWAEQPGVQRGSWLEFKAQVLGETFTIRSLPGIFSFDRVDEGTALLLMQLANLPLQGQRVLDFGCGYGLIGLTSACRGAAWVDLIDVDYLAVAAARENLSRNRVHNASVISSDGMEAVSTQRYDRILSNPPFHAGKEVEYDIAHTLIAHARQLLNQGGGLLLVANRFIRYDRLMMELFGNVRKVAETGKFHVLESIR